MPGLGREGEEYALLHHKDAEQTVGSMWQQGMEGTWCLEKPGRDLAEDPSVSIRDKLCC